MSTRDIAALVELPKSTVARLGRSTGPRHTFNPYMSEGEYVAAYNTVWPERPITSAPFTIEQDGAGARTVRLFTGVARPLDGDDESDATGDS